MTGHQGMRGVSGYAEGSQRRSCPAETLISVSRAPHDSDWQIYNAHLYPFSLNSKQLSPTFFSETTPRGHDPRTACNIAGVKCRGGEITRISVVEAKDNAKGVLLGAVFSGKEGLEPPRAPRKALGITGVPSKVGVVVEAGFEKAMASLSSGSLP